MGIIFLSSILADKRLFAGQLEYFSGNAFFMKFSADDNIDELVQMILSTINFPKFMLVAHGFGAMVALEVARQAWRRVATMCLFGIDDLPYSQDKLTQLQQIEKEVSKLSTELLPKELLSEIIIPVHFGVDNKGDIDQLVVDMASKCSTKQYLAHLRGLIARPNQRDALEQYQRTLVHFIGENDQVAKASEQDHALGNALNCQRATFEGGSHFVQLERPDVVNKLLWQQFEEMDQKLSGRQWAF